ncbi:MAG: hypothetical protein ABH954_03950 [Candidatus Omnitrophota bacterium]
MNKLNIFLKNFAIYFVILIVFSGCIGNIVGTDVRQPKEGQKGRYSQSFNCSFPACYEGVQEILQEMRVLIFYKNQKKRMISAMYFSSIYKNCNDTTEVGIFFKEIASGKTQIDVICGNYNLAKFASEQIFSQLKERLSQ